jgi:hypothetical protein
LSSLTAPEFAAGVRSWLDDHAGELHGNRHRSPASLEHAFADESRFHRMLHDAGWSRWGWPEELGGLGGSPVLRAVLHEEVTAAGYAVPESMLTIEVIGPTIAKYRPDLAALHLPAFLRGDEIWCQGFSEPDAGSDLASLRTRAILQGDSFRINGQKVWTSYGQLSRWCVLLARTGTPESRHRGITAFWLDLQAPGVTVRPIACANGRNELAEVFLDDVVVPSAAVIGEVDRGWDPVMYLMQFERGGFAWGRQGWLHARLSDLLAAANGDRIAAAASAAGEAWLTLAALRERVWQTVVRLADGESPGPEISVDKLLLSGAEQLVYDAGRLLDDGALEFGDDDASAVFRTDWFFSRMVSVYGGAAEVQRDIVAERLMGLPRSR